MRSDTGQVVRSPALGLTLRGDGTANANLDATSISTTQDYGVVMYTHGGGIDRPLAIRKGGQTIIPHESWRGQFASGTYPNGTSNDCQWAGQSGCVLVDWPGWKTNAWHMHSSAGEIRNWFGSLVGGMRDASGQIYKRNRYYDPVAGQFTQVDPIGGAGGLNLYGFASGDPVNFSDPFGLCGPVTLVCAVAANIAARAGPRSVAAATSVSVASSRVLRTNMAAQDVLPRAGHAAHHIVAGKARGARQAQEVLQRFQIDINDAANGVYLPASRVAQAASGGAYHRTLHTNRYYRAVNNALAEAQNREQALAVLRDIANRLQQNTFPK